MLELALVLAVPWLAPLATLGSDFGGVAPRRWFVATAALEVLAATLAAALSPDLDAIGRFLVVLVAFVGALAMVASGPTLHGIKGTRGRRFYFLWLAAFWWSLLVLAISQNLGLSWIAIELTTVTSAILVAISGRQTAVEAAWKYAILCSVGLLLALLGVLFLLSLANRSGAVPSMAALDFSAIHLRAAVMPAGAVRLALILLTVGLGTKIGFAPMHTWLPDAHSEAPAPVSGLLSGVLLPLVLVVLWRVDEATRVAVGTAFPRELLLGFGLLTVLVATPFLLLQVDIKRLLAYSTAEQMGLLAIALGIGSRLAVEAAFVQLAIHALVKSGLFFVAGDVLETFGSKHLPRTTGLLTSHPRLGWPWIVGLLTLSGLPPFPMFLSEIAIVFSLFRVSVWLGGLLAALLTVLFVGMAHYMIQMSLGKPPSRPAQARGRGFQGALAALVVALPLGVVAPFLPHMLASLIGGR